VLGHADTDRLQDIVNGSAAQDLREAHKTNNWSLAPYCENCDFRLHDPEVLVYTNSDTRLYKYDAAEIDLNDYI
jgi:hypothetical protein